jgi:hypothetical protein
VFVSRQQRRSDRDVGSQCVARQGLCRTTAPRVGFVPPSKLASSIPPGPPFDRHRGPGPSRHRLQPGVVPIDGGRSGRLYRYGHGHEARRGQRLSSAVPGDDHPHRGQRPVRSRHLLHPSTVRTGDLGAHRPNYSGDTHSEWPVLHCGCRSQRWRRCGRSSLVERRRWRCSPIASPPRLTVSPGS